MELKDENSKYLPYSEIIDLAKSAGVVFGKGYPYNRLRYYTKIGLLPNAKRKSFGGPPEGAYPAWVVDKLVEIDGEIKTGRSIQAITREQKERNVSTTFERQVEEIEPKKDVYVFSGKPRFSLIPALRFASLLLFVIGISGLIAYNLPPINSQLTGLTSKSQTDSAKKQGNEIASLGEILARTTSPFFKVNVPTNIGGLLTATGGIETEGADVDLGTGELTASNIILGLTGGSGLEVGTGQTPIIDISNTYSGQTSITTLGTIGAGSWNGTPISDTFVDNGLTVDGTGSVNWGALNTFPSDCAATDFVRGVGTTLTCAADGSGAATLQDVYDNGNIILTAGGRDIEFDLSVTNENFIVDLEGTGNIFDVRDSTVPFFTLASGQTITTSGTSSLDINGSLDLPTTSITGAGTGSGLDADLLDGITSANFLRSNTSDSFTSGTLTTNAGTTLDIDGTLAWGGATISENLDMANNLITNVGNAGTDFTSGGGLTIGGTDDLYVNPTISVGAGLSQGILTTGGTLTTCGGPCGAGIIAGIYATPPAITGNGGIVNATIYIEDAPASFFTPHALFVASGESQFEGDLDVNGASNFSDNVVFALGGGEVFNINGDIIEGTADHTLINIITSDNDTTAGFEEHALSIYSQSVNSGGALNDANDSLLDIYIDGGCCVPTGYQTALRIVVDDGFNSSLDLQTAILITTIDDEAGTVTIDTAIDATANEIDIALDVDENWIQYNGVRMGTWLIGGLLYTQTDGGTLLTLQNTQILLLNLDDTTGTYSQRLCHGGANNETGAVEIADCSGTPGDYAEEYGSIDSSLSAGDLVSIDKNREAYKVTKKTQQGSKAYVKKSSKPYDQNIIGAVSTQPNEVIGQNFNSSENPVPVSLNGRVPLKVSGENGSISPGDPLTSSSTSGVAMKATESGPIVGKALASHSGSGVSKIIAFISVGWYTKPLDSGNTQLTLEQDNHTSGTINTSLINLGDNQITLDEKGNIRVNGNINIAGDVTIDGKLFIGDSSSGKATLLKGKTKILINSISVSESSQVFVTPNTLTDKPLIVTEKTSGRFTIEIISPENIDISFDWFVIN